VSEQEIKDLLEQSKTNGAMTVEAFNNLQTEIKNSNGKLDEGLQAIITELKSANDKLTAQKEENSLKPNWTNSFLSDKERTNSDEKEKENMATNRMILYMAREHNKSATPAMLTALDDYKKNSVQSEGTPSTGGYLLPTPTGKLIEQELRTSGLFFSETTNIEMVNNTIKFPTLGRSGHPTPVYVAPGGRKPVKNFTFAQVSMALQKYACLIPWEDEFNEDNPVIDFEALIRKNAKDYFGIIFDDILFRGDSQINGIEDFTTTYQTTAGTGFTSVTLDDIINAQGKLLTGSLKGAKYYMSPSMWAYLGTLKGSTNDHYLIPEWDYSNLRLKGYPVVLTDSAYSINESGANKTLITFGNLQNVYTGMKKGMGIKMDTTNSGAFVDADNTTVRYPFQENLTVMRIEKRVDADIPFPLDIVQIKTATM